MKSAEPRLSDLDVLRLVAAIAVVLYHYAFRGFAADGLSPMPYPLLAPVAKYGYLGVEFFFMISGFVILMSAASNDLRHFVASRIARLYPAFWISCTLTFAVILLAGAPRFTATWPQFWSNLTMFSYLRHVPPIDGVYWSLYVEMQFYLMVGAVLFFRQIHRAEAFLWLWALASAAMLVRPEANIKYYLVTDHAPYFIAGACFHLIRVGNATTSRVVLVLLTLVMALHLELKRLGAAQAYYDVAMSPAVCVLLVLSFYAIFAAIAAGRQFFKASRFTRVAGATTYPLYLIHQNIGFIAFHNLYPQWNAHLLLWGALLAMLLSAFAIHRFVERPLGPTLRRWVAGPG